MKKFTISAVLFGFAAVSLLIARPALADPRGEKNTGEPSKLEQLQKERINALEKIAKILEAQYKSGAVSFIDSSKAQEELIEAKLEATDKPAERIALLEEQLKIARRISDFVERQFNAGSANVSEVDYQRAKAHRLCIEIKLLKESDKSGKK